MLALCRTTSDEQVQKIHGSNLLEKLKCTNRLAEPYYPTKARLNSDPDSTFASDSSAFDAKNVESCTNLELPCNSLIHMNFNQETTVLFNLKTPNTKYKTELCKNFDIYGRCKWGDNCFFAHGKAELKSKIPISQFYKTKVCKHFHRGGFCPYGSRCQYFHFKSYEMNQELLDSLKKKLMVRINDYNSKLECVLSSTERVQSRLSVYKRLFQSDNSKSLQEKFYDNEF